MYFQTAKGTLTANLPDRKLPSEARVTINEATPTFLTACWATLENIVKLASHKQTNALAKILSVHAVEALQSANLEINRLLQSLLAGEVTIEQIALSEQARHLYQLSVDGDTPIDDFLESLNLEGFDEQA